jgi:hypothetical protein
LTDRTLEDKETAEMTNATQSSAVAALLVLTLGLTACGESPPSDSEARAALTNSFRAAGLGVDDAQSKKQLEAIKVSACAKAQGKPGFNCDFTGVLGMTSARFVKGSDGWQVAQP